MSAEPGPAAAGHSPDVMRFCRYLSDRSPQPMVAVAGPGHVVSYLNPAFARLVGKAANELLGRPFAEAVPEGEGNGCLGLLDRVYRTGTHEILTEQEHRQTRTAFWTYSVWAVLGADERPAGVMIQVTDATEVAIFRARAAAMNEALVVSSVRQHELAGEAESLNARLEERVRDRTAELARANASLTAEIEARNRSEAARQDLLRRLGTAQEDERRRIARDLHDQMGQHLVALSLGLKSLEEAVAGPSLAHARLRQLQEMTDLIGREVHQLALDLRPTALDDLGLLRALENCAEEWSARTGVAVDFHSTGLDGDRLPPEVETALYRVVREGLTNVLKHARAGHVSLILRRSPCQVLAVLEDDGEGFDVDGAPEAAGQLGMLGMRERVALVGGVVTVESAPGKGTALFVRVPLPDGDGGE